MQKTPLTQSVFEKIIDRLGRADPATAKKAIDIMLPLRGGSVRPGRYTAQGCQRAAKQVLAILFPEFKDVTSVER